MRAFLVDVGRASCVGLLAAASAFNVPSFSCADDFGRPPATFQVADDAIPIESVEFQSPIPTATTPSQSTARWSDAKSGVTESPTAWKLRWKKPLGVTTASATESRPLAVSRAVMWDNVDSNSTSSAVRQAAQNAPVDPFEEPFSGQPKAETTPTAQPEQLNAAPNEIQPAAPKPMADPLFPPREPATPMPESLQPMTDSAPKPPNSSEPRSDSDLAPVPPKANPLAPDPNDKNCARVYNFRNCCTDDAKCLQARTRFSQYKITSISLDITPSFTNTESPSNPSYVPTDARKQSELAKAPSRTWKNRVGETVAEGRFMDYLRGHIRVRTADGETKEILFNDLSDDDLCFVTAWWSLPTECSLADEVFRQRNWLETTFTWKASALCHKPLYFEEVALERYGHAFGPIKQPFVSGAHFFGSLIALPYQMGMHPPQECQYALGYYRPGSCAPWLVPPFPVSCRGALAEVAAIVGGVYLIP